MTNQTYAERAEESLNLRRQISGLEGIPASDFVFQDTSPPKYWDYVYSTETGERIRVSRHRLLAILEKKRMDGQPAFTTREDNAPPYRQGSVKCFLARDSEYREMVDELRIAPNFYCPAEKLANEVAAQIHAEHRHPTRWRMLKENLDRLERDEERKRQEAQISAILELARGKAPEPVVAARPAVSVSPFDGPTNGQLRQQLMAKGVGLDWPEYKWKRLNKAKLTAMLEGA